MADVLGGIGEAFSSSVGGVLSGLKVWGPYILIAVLVGFIAYYFWYLSRFNIPGIFCVKIKDSWAIRLDKGKLVKEDGMPKEIRWIGTKSVSRPFGEEHMYPVLGTKKRALLLSKFGNIIKPLKVVSTEDGGMIDFLEKEMEIDEWHNNSIEQRKKKYTNPAREGWQRVAMVVGLVAICALIFVFTLHYTNKYVERQTEVGNSVASQIGNYISTMTPYAQQSAHYAIEEKKEAMGVQTVT